MMKTLLLVFNLSFTVFLWLLVLTIGLLAYTAAWCGHYWLGAITLLLGLLAVLVTADVTVMVCKYLEALTNEEAKHVTGNGSDQISERLP